MLEKAFNKIPDNTNLILHSDQGWQYQMKQYQHLLKEKGIRQIVIKIKWRKFKMSKIVKNKLTKVKENAIKYLILSVIDVKMYKSFYRNINWSN